MSQIRNPKGYQRVHAMEETVSRARSAKGKGRQSTDQTCFHSSAHPKDGSAGALLPSESSLEACIMASGMDYHCLSATADYVHFFDCVIFSSVNTFHQFDSRFQGFHLSIIESDMNLTETSP